MRPSAGAWLFLSVTVLAWATTALFAPAVAERSYRMFAGWMATTAPVLGAVLLVMFISELWLDQGRIRRYLDHAAGWRAYAVAVALGVVAMGPTYAWYGLARKLRSEGVAPGLIAAYLYALGVKLPLLPLLVHFFGVHYAIMLCLWMVVFSIAIGRIVGWICPPHSGRVPPTPRS